MSTGPVNRWQEVLYDICFVHELVSAKLLAHKLHKSTDYISDICRRERVDPVAVFNEILKISESVAESNPPLAVAIAGPIGDLITGGTRWQLNWVPPARQTTAGYVKLCEQAGGLCEDLGGAIKAIARIEADGKYDDADDADIAECQTKIAMLTRNLRLLSVELNRRRAARNPL